MNAREFEKVFFHFINANPKYFTQVRREFFVVEEVGLLFEVSKKFYERFLRPAGREQLKLVAGRERYKDKLQPSYIDIIFAEELSQYDQEWLTKTCESWIIWKNLDQSLIDTVEYVKSVNVEPDNVQEMVNRVKTIINDRNSINFSKDLGKDFFAPESHHCPADAKMSTNHAWVDRLTSGGYRKKSLVLYAGETNIGKSIWLANDAVNFVRAGRNVSVISAEMSDTDFVQRIGANMLDVNISEYERLASNEEWIRDRLSMVADGVVAPGKLFVKEYPTSVATVTDIENYLLELQTAKGMKLDVIVIDYVNILCNQRNPNTEHTYMKIKQIAEDLRAMAVRNEWLIITATQLNRAGFDNTEISISHVAESAGLVHTVDVMYGIVQDVQMKAANEYWLKILKIRNGSGKNFKCQYSIDYSRMRLTETENLMSDGL